VFALHHHPAGVVMNLKTVMTAGPFNDVIDEMHSILRLREIFEIQLVVIIAWIIADALAIHRMATGTSIMDIKILDRDTGHQATVGLEGDSLLRGMAALKVVENQVLDSGSNRIDTVRMLSVSSRTGCPLP
jgi:hypothetical protein